MRTPGASRLRELCRSCTTRGLKCASHNAGTVGAWGFVMHRAYIRPLCLTALSLGLAAATIACGGDDGDPNPGAGGDGSGGDDATTSGTGAGGDGGAPTTGAGAGGVGGTTSSSGTGGDPGPTVYEEIDGLVAVEAEHFETNDDLGTPRAWYLTEPGNEPMIEPDPDPGHADSASGSACLEGLPDTRVTHDDPIQEGESIYNNVGTGPTLTYKVHFNNPGTYYVWVRAYSTGSEDNGVHVGIDGTWPDSGHKIQFCSGKNQWTWSSAQRDSAGPCGAPNTITIDVPTAGEHTIAFTMREDGFEFDKWIMTDDVTFEPQDAGPDEVVLGR